MKSERCVLVADDDENDIFLLQRAFRDADIHNSLNAVTDGQQAIDYLSGMGKFSDHNQCPHSGAADFGFEDAAQTGFDVLQWLRSDMALACLPTIMLSSSAHPGDVEKAYRLGARAFVTKPSGIQERTKLARMIKGFWLTFNKLPLVCTEGLEVARKIQDNIIYKT